jgi:solute:Na+ symporter, SSS family
VLLYTYVGGMWSVAITDFVQTIMIIIGLLALTVGMVMQVGGFGQMIAQAPEGFFRFLPEPKPLDMINWFAAWITIGLGSIPQQDVFQRVMGAKSERASIRACYISAFMYLSIAFMPIIIAYCARLLHPELMEGDLQMLIPTMVLKHSGIGMQILFFGALLSAILSTCSGALLAPATVIGENLIRPLRPGLSDAALLRIMRWSVLGVAVVTGGMALSRDNIYELVSESSALSLVSLFVPLLAGLYWKKANATGAISAMVFGMIVWLLTLWLLPGESETPPSNIWLGIPPMLYGLAASILAMFAGSIIGVPRKA